MGQRKATGWDRKGEIKYSRLWWSQMMITAAAVNVRNLPAWINTNYRVLVAHCWDV